MSNNMIRPTRAGTVSIPNSQLGGVAPGMEQRQMMMQAGMQNPMGGMQQQLSVADQVRNMLSQNLGATGGTGGGFNWGAIAGSGYEDPALQAMKPTTDSADSITYYIERVAPAMAEYARQIFHRLNGGHFYDEFKRSREAFRFNQTTGQLDEVRNAFIDDVIRYHEFTKIIAVNGMPFFGKYLINVLKDGGRETFTTNDYLAATNIAVSNVLFLEMVSWLSKTPKGKQFALRLPQYLAVKIANLEGYKEVADATFATFEQPSPYASLEFKRPESTRTDFSTMYGSTMGYDPQLFDTPTKIVSETIPQDQMDDIMRMVNRNAFQRNYGNEPHHSTSPKQYTAPDGSPINWNRVRNDLENLTARNRDEFKLKRYFYNIGKANHYFIPETDWKKIQHAFFKHPEMREEETVLQGCFRIVIIDFDADSGWFSTIVRSSKYDMPTVLTDPSKLLPLLDDPGDLSMLNIHPVKVGDVADKTKLHIDVETCRKLEAEIPLVVVDEQIVSNSSKELDATISSANNRLTANFSDENATAFNVKTWDTFTCARPEDKIRLYKDLPFLFKDGNCPEFPSFFQACRKLLAYFQEGILDAEICNFINQRLTLAVNDWLVNVMGYSYDTNKGNCLTVDSILQDFRELAEHLKTEDIVAAHELHQTGDNGHLASVLKMFTYENPFKERGKDSGIMKMQEELELVLERSLYITVINKRGGPLHTETDVPVYIKRSKFPEYFQLIERGFEMTMGEEVNPDVTDKLIMFSDSGNIWLFSYSAIDRNVATLRHVSRSEPLVLLPLD